MVEANGGGLLGRLLKGKRVAVLNRNGGNWADQVVIPARQAVPLSSLLPLEQAAMFFVNPAAAWVMTRHVLKVPRGAWLLQTAAASALGRMVVRLGQHYGFRTCNVVRREESVAALESIGADGIIVFDPAIHDMDRFAEHVRSMVGSDGVRYAIDPVGGRTASAVVGCLGIGATMLVFGTLDTSPLLFSSRQLMTSNASVRGFWLSHHMEQLSLPGRLRLIRTINRLMLRGILVSETGAAWPLDQVQAAVKAAETPGRTGKVLLRMTDA